MKHLQINAISVQAFAPHVTNSTAFCINRMLMKNPEERFQNYDELKSKLGETKAWATTANAKTMQAHFLCIAHNLMIRCESELEREHGVRNEAELTRRAARLARIFHTTILKTVPGFCK